jgi:DnaB-like helicase N terminal domain
MSSKLTQIQRAITMIEFTLKKRRDLVDSMSRRLDLNENQKIYIGDETSLIKNVEFLLKAYTDVVNQNMGKLPPQAIELEKEVLGGLLLENTTWPLVISFLKDKHFYLETHREIFKSALTVYLSNLEVSINSVVHNLRLSGKLELAGGAYYLAELTSMVSRTANIEFNSRVLVEMAIKRELILLAGHILQESFQETTDCFEILEEAESHFKEINSWIKK